MSLTRSAGFGGWPKSDDASLLAFYAAALRRAVRHNTYERGADLRVQHQATLVSGCRPDPSSGASSLAVEPAILTDLPSGTIRGNQRPRAQTQFQFVRTGIESTIRLIAVISEPSGDST